MQYLEGSFSSVSLAVAALIRDHGLELPTRCYAEVAGFHPSPVDALVGAVEALYTNADLIPQAGLTVCAQLARVAETNQFQELGQTSRASLIVRACRRRLGELDDVAAPPAEDPEPMLQYRDPTPPAE